MLRGIAHASWAWWARHSFCLEKGPLQLNQAVQVAMRVTGSFAQSVPPPPHPPVPFLHPPRLFSGESKLHYWPKIKIIRTVNLLKKKKFIARRQRRLISSLVLLLTHPLPLYTSTFWRRSHWFVPRDMTTLGDGVEQGRKCTPPASP